MGHDSREHLILRSVIRAFIATGNPVGSRFISKRLPVDLSAATIRNIMSDLEEKGLLSHPHTSAGRVPTDRAYRMYVDSLMAREELTPQERRLIASTVTEIARNLSRIDEGVDEILYHSSKALAKVSNELGIILAPRFDAGILDKLDLVYVADGRVLIELSLRSGFVKTLVLDVPSALSGEHRREIVRVLNERLSGLSVGEIKKTIGDRIKNGRLRFEDSQEAVVKLILDSAHSIFNFDTTTVLRYAGTHNILSKPDFANTRDGLAIVEMLERPDDIANLLSGRHALTGVSVTIGGELEHESIANYSIITATYRMGDGTGTVGVIGPKRMPYEKLIPLVEHTAQVLDRTLNQN